MEIIQKKGSTKHTFTFHDDHFNFAYSDKSGSGDADVRYAELPRKTAIQIDQNEWLRNVGYVWLALGVMQLGYAIYSGDSLNGKGFWLLVGGVCVVWARLTMIRYTVFRTDRGGVFVMQDKQHDLILEELGKRRKAQLLQMYGEVNPENDLESEIRKFRWLAEQEVLSKEESEKKIALAELMKRDSFDLPGEMLN